ncbi:hypothetical protein [Arthrobacter sp. MW3 TE3886]|uniref:hypothetical protein n=1 Tax=Arthrobacter sp. MW3 TE3886 TaxID=3156254 RepID=UPI003512A5AD
MFGLSGGAGRRISKLQGGPDPPGRGCRVVAADAGFEFPAAERCQVVRPRPQDMVEYCDPLLKRFEGGQVQCCPDPARDQEPVTFLDPRRAQIDEMPADPGARAPAAAVGRAGVHQMAVSEHRHVPQHSGGLAAEDGPAPQRGSRRPDEDRIPVPRRQRFPLLRPDVDALPDAPELSGLRLPCKAPRVLAEAREVAAENQWG